MRGKTRTYPHYFAFQFCFFITYFSLVRMWADMTKKWVGK